MDTRSKSTDTFKGVISWLCMILLFCIATAALFFLVVLLLNPELMEHLADSLSDLSGYVFYPREHLQATIFFVLYVLGALGLLTVLILLTFLFRRDRKDFEALIAKGLGKVWVEIKLVGLLLLALLFFALMNEVFPYAYLIEMALILCIPVLLLYFLCLDVGHNRKFFSHNIIHSILERVTNFKGLPDFEKRSLRRLYACAGIILGVLLLGGLAMAALNDAIFYSPLMLLLFCGFITVAVSGTFLWYMVALKRDLRDWTALAEQIAEMYGGNIDAVNHVLPASDLYDCAMQLNMIRIGIQKAVEEGVKADRTKVELITNVSHDLKTPLTSIISYVELLKKEPDLPPHAVDYVNTISSKADRLSHIVQDVFDVSKAATGNISLELEDLDLGKLLRQTFAEMDEVVAAAPLTWRTEIPETPVTVHADGQRMYRVFQNLIRNCAQYSLEGSRAYVDLSTEDGYARVSIRNVSKAELSLDGDDLTARFVRGDQNRTTEGSGLGLSIAKSFTEACGGEFSVKTEGDVFTVTVRFPLVPAAAPRLQPELQPQPE